MLLQEEFQNEIDHFLERRKPLIPSQLSGPSGFGVFLQEQKKDYQLQNQFEMQVQKHFRIFVPMVAT